MSLRNKYKLFRHDGTESVEVGFKYGTSLSDAKEQHVKQGRLGKSEAANIHAVEVEITKGGKYIGSEKQFYGKRAILMFYNSQDIVRAQFNQGPKWLTHSWLTFDRADWEIDGDAGS